MVHQCRLVFVSDVGALVCEIGVACCTLLQIFSLRASGAHKGLDERQLNSQIALGIVSVICSCAGLVIMLMGVTAALQAVHMMCNTIRPTRGVATGLCSGSQAATVTDYEDEDALIQNETRNALEGHDAVGIFGRG